MEVGRNLFSLLEEENRLNNNLPILIIHLIMVKTITSVKITVENYDANKTYNNKYAY